ncbi:MAG: cupin domain-containing protein [Verrucomicrobia bacterium]|nr:cupin domain-containing protein [Verrucomicrobiota bacterium]
MNETQAYKINWEALLWIAPMPGVRFKVVEQNGRKLRLVEFQREFREPDWCRKGHWGYVLEGEGDLQFAHQTVPLQAGDGLVIPPGEEHQHLLRVRSERLRVVLVEEA